LTSATSSGLTQCTRLSTSGDPKRLVRGGWLQGLEGGLDTSHAPILHRLLKDNAGRGGIKPSNPYVRAGAPRLVVDITDYGYQYTGIRRLGHAEMHARTYHYILPFHQIRAASNEVGDKGDSRRKRTFRVPEAATIEPSPRRSMRNFPTAKMGVR
jgi:hypothetical protein